MPVQPPRRARGVCLAVALLASTAWPPGRAQAQVSDRQALAVSGEFAVPMAGPGLGAGYTSLTPSVTNSVTVSPSLFLAAQPPHTFDLMKDPLAPDLRVFALRVFLAKFTTAGYFFVFEPRPIVDVGNDVTDVILSPIVGKSLGGGCTLLAWLEHPTTANLRRVRGTLYQFGFQKNF